jgi:ribosomal protein L37AE/L43A
MTDERTPAACPPHRWEITMVRLEAGLHDHYRCLQCAAEKDVPRNAVNTWTRRGAGRTASRSA